MKSYLWALPTLCLTASVFAQTASMPGETTANMATASNAGSGVATSKSDAKRDADNEKHIKDLHTKLSITANEEALWATVESTMRANTKQIDLAVDQRASGYNKATAIDDLNSYAIIAQAHADSVKKLVIAFEPLYAAMPDAQKKVADQVFMHRQHNSTH